MEEIWYADATDLARMIREKVPSCREVVNLAEKVRCFHRRLGEAGIGKYTRAITQYQMIDAFRAVDAARIYRANESRAILYRRFLHFFETHDFLACPITRNREYGTLKTPF